MNNTNKQLALIEKELKSDDNINRVMVEANLPSDEKSKKKVMSYALSVITELDKMSRTLKADKVLSSAVYATPESIKSAMIGAIKYGLPIDSSGLAYLDCRNKEAIFTPTAKGYIYKIKEFYSDFVINAIPFFDGDDVTIENDAVTYKLNNPFCDDFNKFKGFLVKYSYTENLGKNGARLVEGIECVTKADVIKLRDKSKVKFVWNDWLLERAKTAAIKRVAKRLFTNHHALQELINYDNEVNYKLNEVDEVVTAQQAKVIDNIKNAITKQEEPVETAEETDVIVVDVEPEPELSDMDEVLYNKGLAVSRGGSQAVRDWAATLTEEESSLIKSHGWNVEFTKIAKDADSKNNDVPFII